MTNLLIALLLSSTTLLAQDGRFFIKTENIELVKASYQLSSIKHLFKNNYLVSTSLKLAELKELPGVSFAEKNRRSQISQLAKADKIGIKKSKARTKLFTPSSTSNSFFNDPKVYKLWSFSDSQYYGLSVHKYYLSPLLREKVPHTVAVVDTGVDYRHEDLKNNMWINTNEIPDNGIDDDGNGYVDDIYGINTLVRDRDGNASGDADASSSHGTHVAGTIAAVQNNRKGIAGISSSAKIMSLRAVPDEGDETDADVVESFLYAAKHGAKIINCSFGKKFNEGGNIVNETITHIGQEYGVLVIAAAGNDSKSNDRKKSYPASFDSDYLLVVASTKKKAWLSRPGLSDFSNYGRKTVDVAAPGSNIYSTTPGNRYESLSGTSMASPAVAGVASEILANFPKLGPLQIKEAIINSSIKEKRLRKRLSSGGRVDLYRAIQYVLENYIELE